ncbi:MAG: OmpA family protein [Rhodothermales bacterium]|nr:OmpA family protein [Rhodothermales bacterium]
MCVMFALVVCIAILREPARIQRDVLDSTERAIGENDFRMVRTSISGRDVTVRGSVLDVEDRQKLHARLDSVVAIRKFSDRTVMGEERSLQLRNLGRRLVLTGVAPDERTQGILTEYAKQVFGRFRVSDETALIERDIDLGWPNTVRYLIEVSKELGPSEITVVDTDIKIVPGVTSRSTTSAIATMRQTLHSSYTVVVDTMSTASDLSEEQCLNQVLKIVGEQRIEFSSGSATLDIPNSIRSVDAVSATLRRCPQSSFEVVGHTDSSGNEESNQVLSRQRAESVVSRLVSNGIDSDRLRSRGLGSADPVADNDTADGKAENRRIEFKLVIDEL